MWALTALFAGLLLFLYWLAAIAGEEVKGTDRLH
jgi:hypothetical protein